MIDARPSERAEHRELGRAHGARREHRQLGVGFVLVRSRALDRDAGRCECFDAGLAERIAIPDPAVDREPERPGVTRAPVRGDDPRSGLQPARPRGVEGGPRTYLPIGKDDDLHGQMLTAGGLDPM